MISSPPATGLCTHLYITHHLSRPGALLHCRLAIRFGEQHVSYWPSVDSLPAPLGYAPSSATTCWLIVPTDLYQRQATSHWLRLFDRILVLGAAPADFPQAAHTLCFGQYVDMVAYLYTALPYNQHVQATHPLRGELPDYITQVIDRWGDKRVIRALLLCRATEQDVVLPIRRPTPQPTLGLHPYLIRDEKLLGDLSVKARLWLLRQGEMQQQLYSLY